MVKIRKKKGRHKCKILLLYEKSKEEAKETYKVKLDGVLLSIGCPLEGKVLGGDFKSVILDVGKTDSHVK